MNIAKKFLEYLSSRNLEAPCEEVQALYDIYKYSSVYIQPKHITVTENLVSPVYKFKYEKFLELVNHLDSSTISEDDLELVNKFLSTCSKLEVVAFTKILTTPKTVFNKFLPIPKEDLGQCIVQQIPKNTSRCIIKVVKGDIKVLLGNPTKEQLSSLSGNFRSFVGILYFFIDKEYMYWYDLKDNVRATKRMLYLSSQRESKILKILTPYFFDSFLEALRYHYNSDILLKPIKGEVKDTYIHKGFPC